jgi:hypothetical protein
MPLMTLFDGTMAALRRVGFDVGLDPIPVGCGQGYGRACGRAVRRLRRCGTQSGLRLAMVLFCVSIMLPGAPAQGEIKGDPTMVVMETSHGSLTIEFYPEQAPVTVANFLQYVDDGFFDGTVFHRVIPGFVIQGRWLHRGHAPEAHPRSDQERG